VGRQHERDAGLLQAVEAVPDDVPCLRVEAGGRLVQQHHLGVVDERPRDREPALHPARERLDLVVRPLRELDELEELVGTRPEGAPRKAEVPAVDHDVLPDGELHVERVHLRNDPEPAPDRHPVLRRVEAEHAKRPVRHGRDAADHAHGRRLSRPVRAEEAEGLASLEVEVDPVHRSQLAELLDEPAGVNQWLSVLPGHDP